IQDMEKIDFQAAAAMLYRLHECVTPLQMLHLLTDCVDCIISIVESSNSGKFSSETDLFIVELRMTTDDLIPIITYIITQSKFEYYESMLYYIESFIFADISTTKFG